MFGGRVLESLQSLFVGINDGRAIVHIAIKIAKRTNVVGPTDNTYLKVRNAVFKRSPESIFQIFQQKRTVIHSRRNPCKNYIESLPTPIRIKISPRDIGSPKTSQLLLFSVTQQLA